MKKRWSALFIVIFILLGISACGTKPQARAGSAAEDGIVLIACSDFQNPDGNDAGRDALQDILSAIKKAGITEADGFFSCGDYDYDLTRKESETKDGVDALREAVGGIVTENMVFVQGNHDSEIGTAGMSPSGNNDPKSGAYGVFVINEDDYMWGNEGGQKEQRVMKTAQRLIEYLNDKLKEGYDKPIFVLSHLPLHYSMRTVIEGDAKYAGYLFDVLNKAGKKGLNIIFLYGHDHNNGWDDYLGGACVYLAKGDTLLIASGSTEKFQGETLCFTYMNAGYTGYYGNQNGADDALTMSVFRIRDDEVEICRYSKTGVHDLKSAGKRNSYKNESAYEPNETVWKSPQSISLTAVTDTAPLEDLLEPVSKEGRCYRQVESAKELKDGGRYLLIYEEQSSLMIPQVVTKNNESGERTGLELKSIMTFDEDVIYGEYSPEEWMFTKENGGWKLGHEQDYLEFTTISDRNTVILGSSGTILQAEDNGKKEFLFGTETAYLNYNNRGLIDTFGRKANAAKFLIYELVSE